MINYSIIKKSQLEDASRIDAEYFQPEYLELEKRLISSGSIQSWGEIDGKFITGPFGSEFNVENYETNGKFRYIRGKDVKEFFLQGNDNVYIPEKDFYRLEKYSVQGGDILISVVGTLGNVSIIDDSVLPSIFSCKSTLYRSKVVDPYFLITFLNSYYGKNLLIRNGRGHVQVGLNIDDLKNFSVYLPTYDIQKEIRNLVERAYKLISDSKYIYLQAEKLLLEELGLKDYKIEENLTFVVNFSDIKSSSRIDPDYFQTKYELLVNKLKEKSSKIFSEVIENVPARFDPLKKPDEAYRYVELANINSSLGIIDGYSEVLGREAPSRAKRLLKEGDVIVSSIGGSLDKVALVDKENEGSLASTGFFQLRSKEILPEVLLVIAKSIVLQMQLEKLVSGTILAAVPNESLKNMIIPILPKETQQNIADLVRKSHEARKKSKELLAEAKRRVEEMIEKGGDING